jgi:hypothetical protein
MSLRKVAGLLVAFGLTVGLIGAGVGATFTASATGNQTINVGTFKITLDSSTPGATVSPDGLTLTCPNIPVLNSAGPGYDGTPIVPCNIQIKSTGTIKPAGVTLTMVAGVAAGSPNLSHFGINVTGPGTTGGFFYLKSTPQTIANAIPLSFPLSYNTQVDWGQDVMFGPGDNGLDNGDLGASIVVTYTVTAWQ